MNALPRPNPIAVRARVRRTGGRTLRRLGLVPGGQADGLGEDDQLGQSALQQSVIVFFPEPPVNLYQLRQWYEPLRALDAQHGVAVITADSRTTRQVRQESDLRVLCVARTSTLDGLVARSDLGLALYVSHHGRNFQALRFTSMTHVYLGHGESDKDVSASNQLKAYDQAFVAGPAAVERIAGTVPLYDTDRRVVQIGRPQIDVAARGGATGGRSTGAPPRVLYAPTWEGGQASVAYGSLATHGQPVVRSLLAAGCRVTYRPHPRVGATDHQAREKDQELRRLLVDDRRRLGRVDSQPSLAASFAEADLLITDISSVALDWLPSGKPLLVTQPQGLSVVVSPSPMLQAVPRLTVAQAHEAGRLVLDLVQHDPRREERMALVEHYLGDVTPGAATGRFLAACRAAIELRDAERRRLAELRG